MTAFRWVKEEWRKLVRFGLIGGLSFLLNAALYGFFSRFLWPSGSRQWENFLAGLLAAIFNFFAHRGYTFRSTGRMREEGVRYLVVMVSAMSLQNALFWFGHGVLKWYDAYVFVGVGAFIPLFTYALHRVYTFRRHSPAGEEGMGELPTIS